MKRSLSIILSIIIVTSVFYVALVSTSAKEVDLTEEGADIEIIETAAKTPTVYSQLNDTAAYNYPGGSGATYKSSGCGVYALVNAVKYLTDKKIDPHELGNYAIECGARVNGGTHGVMLAKKASNNSRFGEKYGFELDEAYYFGSKTRTITCWIGDNKGTKSGYPSESEWNTLYSKLTSKLSSGEVAVVYVFGHYMALVDYNRSTDKFLMLDSAAYKAKRLTENDGRWQWVTADQLNYNKAPKANSQYNNQKPYIQLASEIAFLKRTHDNRYIDIGDDFYATITNKNNGKPIENQDDNVVLGSNEPSERHVWKFYRNDDLSYNIVNRYNWKALDLESYGNTNGTNIKCYENTNVSAQRWYIMKAEGGYALVPKCSENGVMDLDDNNSDTGTNIQFWTYNGTSAQIYNINKIDDIRNYLASDLGDDFYGVIFNKNHNKPIENRNGNVVLGTENHSENQVWHFIKNDDNTYNIVSLFDSKALDVSSYGNENGTNIKVYENSNNDAQRWYLNEAYGGYAISPKCSPNGVMDLEDNDSEDGTNIQFWEYNSTLAQIYTIEKLEDMHGYLSSDIGTDFYGYIKYSAADLRLTNFEGNVTANTPEDMPNQIWRFERQSDNSYLIRSCLDDNCIDSENGEFEDGNNVQTYPDNGTRAQRWYFIKHGDENKYTIKSQLANSLIDVEDSSFESGTNVHLWHPNDTNAQIFEIEVCDEETVNSIIDSLTDFDDYFYGVITNTSTGFQVVNNDQNVEIASSAVEAKKLWRFERQQDFSYSITSFLDGSYLDAKGGKCSNGTNVQTYEDNATQAQRWYLKKSGENQYIIKSGLGDAVLNIEALQDNIQSGDNIGLFTPNSNVTQSFSVDVIEDIDEYLSVDMGTDFLADITNYDSDYKLTNSDDNVVLSSASSSIQKANQTWRFEKQEENSYLIRCVSNGKCLDAANANDFDGNNVQVYEDNGTIAQRWIIVKTGDNQYLIKSVLGETVLDAYTTGGVVSNNTNVQVYHPNGTSAQIYQINKKPLRSVSIKQQPNKTTYFIGQPFDTTGLKLERDFGDGVTDVVDSGFTISGFDSSTAGSKTITVTYQGKSTSFEINVNENPNIFGDVDGDGEATVLDATYILRYNVNMQIPIAEDVMLLCGDVDGDGEVSVIDATFILRHEVMMNTPYPIGEPIA